jgi:hypothetical protein
MKGCEFKPILVCLKNKGPSDSSLMMRLMIKKTGNNTMSKVTEIMISIHLFNGL